MSVEAISIDIRSSRFDPGAETESLTRSADGAGAVVCFTGLCRDENGRLAALELEHYPTMAESEIRRIAEDAAARWKVLRISVIHRFGRIAPGEEIVFVGATSIHRRDAFQAADFIMDYLKTNAPFWKKEHLRSSGSGTWVEARQEDEKDASRWR